MNKITWIISMSSMSSQHNTFEKITLNQFPQLYDEIHLKRQSIVLSTSKFQSSCSLHKVEQWESLEIEIKGLEKGF